MKLLAAISLLFASMFPAPGPGHVAWVAEPPASGGYPSASDPLGHNHPECLAVYGLTPAQIEATPCSMPSGNALANTTYSACSLTGAFDFKGSNVTLDCVNWDTGDANGWGFRCNPASGHCDNITFRRVTAKGNNANAGGGTYSMNFLRFTTYSGHQSRSALVEKSDISEADVLIMGGSGLDSDTLTYPGESHALVIRDNRLHHITLYSGAHTDGIFLTEGAKGVLVERNLIDATGSAYNWGSMIQDQPTQAGAGNHVFRNNHIITDASGVALNFDGNTVCAAPVVWDDNRVDLNSALFSYTKMRCVGGSNDAAACSGAGDCPGGTCGVYCANIEDRGGISSCTGNVFESGSPQTCSSNGL